MNPGDDQLIQGLLYDAKATRGALANWMKVNADGTLNDSMSRRYVLFPLFVGHASVCSVAQELSTHVMACHCSKKTQLFVYANSSCTADNNVPLHWPRPLQILSQFH